MNYSVVYLQTVRLVGLATTVIGNVTVQIVVRGVIQSLVSVSLSVLLAGVDTTVKYVRTHYECLCSYSYTLHRKQYMHS